MTTHAQCIANYSALLLDVKHRTDTARNIIEYEIRGPARLVKHEIDRIGRLLAVMPEDVKWTACFGPPQWVREGESVSFGEVYVPRQAENFWRMVGTQK